MASPIVQFVDFARRRLALVKQTFGRDIKRFAENFGAGITIDLRKMFQRNSQRQKFAQRIPTQMVLFTELLNMLGSRSAGSGFKQSPAVHQRNNRKHLRTGSQLQNRKQIGEIVTHHVSSDRDCVLAVLDTLKRISRRVDQAHDLDLQPVCIMILEVCFDFFDQLSIMSARLGQPKYSRPTSSPSTIDREFHPILNRTVFDATHPPDIAR